MSFTKIAAAGIGSTETVTLHSLEVLNNATIGGVLTYEDVTNVDSIGIITARAGVLVGSGITLSKDGDIFATGVTTTGSLVSSGAVSGTTGTFTGDVDIADKIIHTGDTNTSIRFPADDKVTVETTGTERLAIEPAGNVNVPKSVVVGTGLTVGTSGSTSVFLGQGHIELTRSSGDTHIDFKDAFADDFDSRIISTNTSQLQFFTGGVGASAIALQTNTGKVAISTAPTGGAPTVAKLQIHSDKLGGTAGNTQELLYLTSPDVSNSTTYRFTTYRHTNGTTHTSSEGRLRRHVDATDMGFLGFGDGYVNIGYGTAEKARIGSDGRVLMGTASYTNISSNSVLTLKSSGSSATRFNLENSGSSSPESTQIFSQSNELAFTTSGSERVRIASDGKLSIDRTHASATTGNHPALDIDTYANGTAGATFATGIDFRVAGVHKKRLAITNGSGTGGGDWIFYRDNGNNIGMQLSSAGYITAPQQPYLQVGITGNISVSANNSYEIVFNQENYDTANAYNTSNGRYIVPVTGDYLCTLDVQYTAEVNGFHLGIAVNNSNPGTNFDIWNHTGDGVRGDNVARVIRVTANGSNYISFYTYTTSGGTLEVNRTKATIKFLG